jgi:hypothetical protein
MIKDATLVAGTEETEKVKLIIIKRNNPNNENNDTKLGDVLNAMPHGLILKEETGMGATTLELNSLSNSIIVEPIKATASSYIFYVNQIYCDFA